MTEAELKVRQERREIYERGLKDGINRCITALLLDDQHTAVGVIEDRVDTEKFENQKVFDDGMHLMRPETGDAETGGSTGP